MARYRFNLELGERRVDLLFSVTLGYTAKRKGISLSCEDSTNPEERLAFFVRLLYVAALNAWEYNSIDDPSLGEFPFRVIDFAEWATANPKDFAEMIKASSEAMAGLFQKETGGEVKKK